jgi:CheY-like chemotaxis protein
MDGVELSHRLRQIAPQVKILLVTGSDLIGRETIARDGFCGLLQKPFQLNTMKDALEAIGIAQSANDPAVLAATLF